MNNPDIVQLKFSRLENFVMKRRDLLAATGAVGLASLAGCSGESGDEGGSGSGGGGSGGNDGSGGDSTPTPQQTLTHEIGESFVVGDGAQSIEYTVNGYETIEDYIGPSSDIGSTPDGIFTVVTLDLENVGEESLDLTSKKPPTDRRPRSNVRSRYGSSRLCGTGFPN